MFSGQFTTETATTLLHVGVVSTARGGHVTVAIYSPTAFQFSRELTPAEVDRWVKELERSLEIGPRLLKDLNTIAPP